MGRYAARGGDHSGTSVGSHNIPLDRSHECSEQQLTKVILLMSMGSMLMAGTGDPL
jgi:hypothetical protein